MNTLEYFLQLVAVSSVVTAALVVGLIWLCRQWLLNKISLSIRYDYEATLATHIASLTKQRQIELAEFRKTSDHQNSLLAAARGAVAKAQEPINERRLRAIDDIWSSVVYTRDVAPDAFRTIDALRPDEFREVIRKGKHTFAELSAERLTKYFGGTNIDRADLCRPYVGDEIFGLCQLYKGFINRTVMHTAKLLVDPSTEYWHENKATVAVVQTLLTPDQFRTFLPLEFGKLHFIERVVETRICVAITKLLTGELQGQSIVEHGQEYLRALTTLDEQSRSSNQK
jgi:hypothetical protein